MSARLRSTPWWEQCEDFYSSIPAVGLGPYGLFIGRNAVIKGLGHKLELEGAVNPQDPDGIFFATCPYCVRAATRRRRLAQAKIVIVLDWKFKDYEPLIFTWEQGAYMKRMYELTAYLHDIDPTDID